MSFWPTTGRVAGDAGADRNGPIGKLVPRQQVTGEGQRQRQQKQHHAQHPVELARRFVGAGVEDAAHVQHHKQHHQVGRPAVQVAQHLAGRDHELQVFHVLVGVVGGRHVIEHQQHAGRDQDEEQVKGDQPQPQRGAKLQRAPVDLGRLQVQQEARDGRLRPLQVARRQPDAEDRAAYARALECFPESLSACHTTRVLVGLDRLRGVNDQMPVPAERQLKPRQRRRGRSADHARRSG